MTEFRFQQILYLCNSYWECDGYLSCIIYMYREWTRLCVKREQYRFCSDALNLAEIIPYKLADFRHFDENKKIVCIICIASIFQGSGQFYFIYFLFANDEQTNFAFYRCQKYAHVLYALSAQEVEWHRQNFA